MNLNFVKHVDIHSQQITNDSVNYFPNATELTIRYNFNTLVITLNRILPLHKPNKLVLTYYTFPFEEIIKLLRFTPNLHTLKIRSISFCQNNRTLIQHNDIFRYVSNMNQIKNFDLHESCTLEYIQMIVNLFPRLEYFKTGLYRKEIEPIARFLFSKTNNLVFLCISYTAKIHLKKLKMFIKKENLLEDYFIDLYIWW